MLLRKSKVFPFRSDLVILINIFILLSMFPPSYSYSNLCYTVWETLNELRTMNNSLLMTSFASPFRYSIDRHTDLDRYFSISPEDGSITTTKKLDREEIAWHNISVLASEVRKYSKTNKQTNKIPVLVCTAVPTFEETKVAGIPIYLGVIFNLWSLSFRMRFHIGPEIG